MPVGQSLPLNSVVRIEEHQAGIAHRLNDPLGPERTQGRFFGDFLSKEYCVFQHTTPLQGRQWISERTSIRNQFCQLIKQLWSEVPEFIGSSKITKVPFGVPRFIVHSS